MAFLRCNSKAYQPGMLNACKPREDCYHWCSRRQLLHLPPRLLTSFACFVSSDRKALAQEGKFPRLITNLDEAREEGERKRAEKERAQGPIVTLPSGVKFRELRCGEGKMIASGDYVSIYFTIYKLNGLYLDSMGYGNEGKNDVGEALTFQYGIGLMPKAIELGMEGMQVGGKRRILVTPDLGWVFPNLLPLPISSAAERRLANNRKQALLFEVELVRDRS